MRYNRFFVMLVLTLGILLSVLFLNASDASITIGRVTNNSSGAIKIFAKRCRVIVSPRTTRLCACSVRIPLISALEDHDAFVKDEAYIPTGALALQTGKGTFFIWRDEIAVMCALLKATQYDDRKLCKPWYIWRYPVNTSLATSLALSISESGIPSLKS